jgi:glycerophosphoryl diester phosphodiesterase
MAALTRPLVIAHRGESAHAPEQTLAAFERAAALGADLIEVDVRRTRDGRLVLMHDANVARTTDGEGLVGTLTLAELRELDAGAWFGDRFAGERIPTLEEAFDLAERDGVALCLEAKGESPAEYESVACAVAREIAARGRLEHDVLASFDHGALGVAAHAVRGLRTAPDRLPERGPSNAREVVEQAETIGAQIIQHHHLDLTAETVELAHAAGVAVWAWPPETAADIARMLELHVDGVMGDDVAAIASAVNAAP